MTNVTSIVRIVRPSSRTRVLAALPMLALASVLQSCGSDDPTEPPDRSVVVTGTGTHSGNVQSSPGGIDCAVTAGAAAGSCSATFESGSLVTLQATASAGSRFAGWGGACSGTAPCSLSLVEDRAVSANFGPPPTPQ